MNELKINRMERAFGIKKLTLNINNDKSLKNVAIYAPNGTFKTSFARTFDEMQKGNRVYDRLTDEDSLIECYLGTHSINPEILKNNMIVFSRNIMDQIDFSSTLESEMSRITTIDYKVNELRSLNQRIEMLFDEINQVFITLKISQNEFNQLLNIEFSDKLRYLKNMYEIIHNSELIEYDDLLECKQLFAKTYAILDDNTFIQRINEYRNILINENGDDFFTDGFSINNAINLINALKTSNFINKEKNRYVVIGDHNFYSIDEFFEFINKRMMLVVESENGKSFYDYVYKTLGKSKASIEFKRKLETDINYVSLLSHNRKAIIMSKIKRVFNCDLMTKLSEVEEIRRNINDIAEEAKSQKTIFEEAIEIFNTRFTPVFETVIENKEKIYMNHSFPQIKFIHKKCPNRKNTLNEIDSILSSGEKTALNVIKFIVRYECIKQNKPVLILDDVVETFDYGNRYAFIRYIQELKAAGCNIVVLSNNYEFFRTVCSRAELTPIGATLNSDNSVSLSANKNLFLKHLNIPKITSYDKLLFAIPFARETDNLRGGKHSEFYDSLFHYNKSSTRVHVNKVQKVLNDFSNQIQITSSGNPKYIDILYEECKKIMTKQSDPFEIKPKVILALGIRIKCEELIIGNDFTKISNINENQTRALYDKYKHSMKKEFVKIMDELLVATPEFLHLNAFMYEPLIDIKPNMLKDIFKRLLQFENEGIWI